MSIEKTKFTDSKFFHVDFLKATFRDFARTNLYKVEFIFADMKTNDDILKLELMIKSVNMPDFQIGSKEIRRMGQKISLPAVQNYGEVQMIVLCDDAFTQRKLLHNWIKDFIYDTEENTFHSMNNLKKFKTRIFQLDNKHNIIFGVEFDFCWPSSLGELQLSMESDSQITEFPVNLKYSTYTVLEIT
jgi:hypothetical protein